MCDYSLHAVATRPAEVGETLVSTKFQMAGTRGFASPDSPRVAVCLRPGTELGIAPCFVELCEAVVAVNDVKRPSQFGQERDCWSPFRSERQAQAAMPEAACKL